MTTTPSFDLSRLLGAQSAEPGREVLPDTDLETFRLRLAVRGWTAPAPLTTKDSRSQLEAIASEVETAADTRPGQWFLSMASRTRMLRTASDAMLRAALTALSPDDKQDPVRLALALWHRGSLPGPQKMSDGLLRALPMVAEWLGARWNEPYGRAELDAEIARRGQDGDIDRLTRYPLIGASHEDALDALVEFALNQDADRQAVYVHGTGGMGKTTLLAFFEKRLRERHPGAAVVRIDFDDVAIDPARSVTLNLALVERLGQAVETLRPWCVDAAASLRRIAAVQSQVRFGRPGRRSPDPKLAEIRARSYSDQGSVLNDMLSPARRPAGPLVLILDTAELVLSHSDHISASVASWINFLLTEGGAHGLRLVIAGRDPPPAPDGNADARLHLLDRIENLNVVFAPPIALRSLDRAEAAELLRNCGVDDPSMAAAAADSVPGNPLLLRVTADALLSSDGSIRDAVRTAHSEKRMDKATAQNYLMRRLVAHVADPEARPYVLAALYLPMLSRDAVLHAVIPAVDRALGRRSYAGGGRRADGTPDAAANRFADRVFASLSATHWLTRPSLDRSIVPFNRDLRDFALGLLRAIPDHDILERDLRQSAALHHARRRGASHRAFEFYHRAMLGITFPNPSRPEDHLRMLRDVLEELPASARATLEVEDIFPGRLDLDPGDDDMVVAHRLSPSRMTDVQWRFYLEGDGKSEGEGDKLVGVDRAAEALDMYRDKPTRGPGQPPTFVLRALAEIGEWSDPLVNLKLIFDESETRGSTERIYWAMRLALLEGNGRISPQTTSRLINACHDTRESSLALLPSLAALVEAHVCEPVMPPRMRRAAAKSGSDGRAFLDPFLTDNIQTITPNLSSLLVVQRNWMRRIEESGPLRFVLERPRLRPVEQGLAGLHGQSMSAVNELFVRWDGRLPINLERLTVEDRRFLLRGQTPELHRPLREALLTVGGDEWAGQRIVSICQPVLDAMTIRPVEMRPKEFFQRVERNPRVWFSALVGYADQCRLLPLLARGILSQTETGKAARIARCYLAWDELLSGGTSLWGHEDFKRKG